MNMKTFYINNRIVYNEMNIDNEAINKFYEIHNPTNEKIVAIPDGCIDIQYVWKDGVVHSQLCGSFMQGNVSSIGDYDYCFGVKFNPGKLPAWINADAKEIMNKRCNLYEYATGCSSECEMQPESSLEEKVRYFLEKYECRVESNDKQVMTSYVVKKIDESKGYININELVERVGYSHCYTDRVFKDAVGISMKQYANIVRLQKSIDILADRHTEEVYDTLGYYDQSHFIKDFKKFTLLTPKGYFKNENELRFV